MKNNMTKNRKIIIAITIPLVVIITLGLLFALNINQVLSAFGVSKPAPIFTFNESKAPGWWAGDNYNNQASAKKDNQGTEPLDKLATAGMTVLKGEKGEYKTACFVMFSYYDYKVDIEEMKADQKRDYAANESAKNMSENTVSMNLFGKDTNFTLTNYGLIGTGAENAMTGMGYGWVEAGDGYVSVSTVCPTADELKDTVPLVGAMSLVKS